MVVLATRRRRRAYFASAASTPRRRAVPPDFQWVAACLEPCARAAPARRAGSDLTLLPAGCSPNRKQRHRRTRAVALGGEGTATSSGAVEPSTVRRKQIVAWGCSRTAAASWPRAAAPAAAAIGLIVPSWAASEAAVTTTTRQTTRRPRWCARSRWSRRLPHPRARPTSSTSRAPGARGGRRRATPATTTPATRYSGPRRAGAAALRPATGRDVRGREPPATAGGHRLQAMRARRRVRGPAAIAPRDGRPRVRDMNPPVNVSRFEQELTGNHLSTSCARGAR